MWYKKTNVETSFQSAKIHFGISKDTSLENMNVSYANPLGRKQKVSKLNTVFVTKCKLNIE